MKSFRLHFLWILFFIISTTLSGQYTEEWAKNHMWESGDPDFETTEIPEKWEDESAVILCKSSSYEFKKQVMAAKVNSDYYFRQRIKLLDKSAVDEFSEFKFEKLGKVPNSREGIFLGIRIIKPDGSQKEINIDDAVEMQKYRNSKEKRKFDNGYKKLAIPDLEIGDIIDYYYVSINTISTKYSGKPNRYEFDPLFLILTDDYPILKGKIGFLPERRCFINLSVSNGAPGPVRKTVDEKDYYVITYGDLDKTKTELWTFPYRQEPTVKIQVIIAPPDVSSTEKYFLGKPEFPKTSVTDKEYLRLLKTLTYNSPKSINYLETLGKKFIKKQRISEDPATMAEDLFYYYRHHFYFKYSLLYGQKYFKRYNYDSFDFIQGFSNVLKDYDIDHFVFLGVPRTIGTIDNAVLLDEITFGIKVNINNKPVFIYDPGGHTVFGEGDFTMETTKIIGTNITRNTKTPILVWDSIPSTLRADNYQMDSIHVSFDADQENNVRIYHQYLTSGNLKEMLRYLVLTPDDYFKDEYDQFQDIKYFKDSDMNTMLFELDEVKKQSEKDNEARMENLEAWLKESHIVDDLELETFNLIQQGRFNDTPDIIFECEFQTPEMAKSTGKYLIFEAGKLIGKNIDFNQKEKEREKDIYMPCPRQYDWIVTIDIPKGYTIGNVDNFNLSAENNTGGFKSEAIIEDGKVTITATKFYVHNFEPLDNWPAMLEFMDIANDFVQQKMIFKKVE